MRLKVLRKFLDALRQYGNLHFWRASILIMDSGLLAPVFATQKGKYFAFYQDTKVLVTSKKLYYPEEAIAILTAAAGAGANSIVVIAKDFMGQFPNIMAANHMEKKMNVLLVKDNRATDKDEESLQDLADYLGVDLIGNQIGSLVDNLKPQHLASAKKIISDPKKTVILRQEGKNKKLDQKLSGLRIEAQLTKSQTEKENIEKRISYLTSGLITIFVGGNTRPEIQEKMMRYEDAINSSRNAKKEGYVVGGGLTIWNAFQSMDKKAFNKEIIDLMRKFCQAPLTQIAENCDVHFPTMIKEVTKKIGYNALTDVYEDLDKAGIIEPRLVLERSIENSVSVASLILSSGYLIRHEDSKKEEEAKVEN